MTLARRYNEKVPCNYRLLKDLQDRLDGTICRYGGKAYYISVGSEEKINLYDVERRREIFKVISPDDPELDISFAECGYMNFTPTEKQQKTYGLGPEGVVLYVTRNTSKKYKQGNYPSYTQLLNISGSPSNKFDYATVCFSRGMVDFIEGVYPSPLQVLKEFSELKGKVSEVAVSPEIALRKESVGVIFVYYRGTQMGWIAPDTMNIVVTDHELKWVVERHMTRLTWK